jgi:hypothetical protein
VEFGLESGGCYGRLFQDEGSDKAIEDKEHSLSHVRLDQTLTLPRYSIRGTPLPHPYPPFTPGSD